MNPSKTALGVLAAAMMFGGNASHSNPTRPADIKLNKKKVIPNGCKEYFFNYLGDFLNHNDGVYAFKCIASNDKVAVKKFEKWRDKQFDQK